MCMLKHMHYKAGGAWPTPGVSSSSVPPRPQFDARHWRKSSQFFTLTRRHAEAVLADSGIFRAFEEHCWAGWVPEYYRRRDCFSDEVGSPGLVGCPGPTIA